MCHWIENKIQKKEIFFLFEKYIEKKNRCRFFYLSASNALIGVEEQALSVQNLLMSFVRTCKHLILLIFQVEVRWKGYMPLH